jgi:hypothetical protein
MKADAYEIRTRAVLRIGEMMNAQKETVGLAPAGRPKIGLSENPISNKPPTRSAAGIDKNLAQRARTLAALAADKVELLIRDGRRKISSAADQIKRPATTDFLPRLPPRRCGEKTNIPFFCGCGTASPRRRRSSSAGDIAAALSVGAT